jgi:hypothetical protein
LLQLQALHHTYKEATRLFLMAARLGFTDAQIADVLRKGLPKLNENDNAFTVALEAVPAEDWCRTWATGRTILLRRTSKRVKEAVDKMRLPAVVRLSRSFWDDARNGMEEAKLQFVLRQLASMTAWCLIHKFELPECEMKGQNAQRFAGVLEQCPALAHLDLSENYNFGAAGAKRLAGVLGQCRELVHFNLSGNNIRADGAQRLAGVLGQCAAPAHLNLSTNDIEAGGAKMLAGVLAQCTALAHLNLCNNWIGPDGAESLAGVLAQCHLALLALCHLFGRQTTRKSDVVATQVRASLTIF